MQTSEFKELKLSRLMLGTVQFGLNYGIANKSGQPSYETARDIIACAYQNGVTCLDTAALYGESEEVLGRALAELKIADDMAVVTKICHMADNLTASEAEAIIEESIICSLRHLRLDVLPICLFHTENNFHNYSQSLLKMKDKGLVRNTGSSVNTPEAAARIIKSGLADAVQMPTSVLDHRYIRMGVCEESMKRGGALFVRSIYLQGLILMPEEDILPELAEVIPVRRKLQSLGDEAGIGLVELASRYVLGITGITSLVVGVDSAEQMRENIELIDKGPLPADLHAAVTEAVPDLPENILFPGKWTKRMPDAKPKS